MYSKRRRVMRAFKIDEISAVDNPAQAEARAVLMKRDFSSDARQRMADSGEAMPDGSFPIPDKGALARAVASVGRAKDYEAARSHIIRRARALGAIDSLPAEWKVTKSDEAALRAAADEDLVKSLSGEVEATDFATMLAADEASEVAEEVAEELRSKWLALQQAFVTIAMDASVPPPDKIRLMQESLQQFVDSLSEQSSEIAESMTKAITAVPALAELLHTGSEGGTPMTEAEKRQLAELQTSVADLTKKLAAATSEDVAKKAADLAGELEKAQTQLADLTEKLEKADAEKTAALAKAGMTDAEKAYCSGMSDTEKGKFMAMTPEERAKAMKKSAESDPVVYKSESTGEEFRKSDDPRLVKLAKQADEDRALAKAEREAREAAEFAKVADDELKAFSESVAKRDDKIAVVRAMSKMDEGPREALRKMLGVGSKAVLAAFDTIGHRGGEIAKSGAAFEKRVGEIQARDKCSKIDALEKAAQEFPSEFAAYQQLGN